jgi:aminopeptidase
MSMQTTLNRELDAYGELIVKVGLNLQPGQRLLIRAPIEAAPLVRQVAAHAYDLGARLVETIWNDPLLILTRFSHAPEDSFEEHSYWPVKAGLEYAENGHAILSIGGSDPDLLKDVDPALITTVQRTEGRVGAPLSKLISGDAINWCVVAYPATAWANKVFSDLPAEERQAKLWHHIARAVRLDRTDPLAEWQTHAASLEARANYLNEKQYTALHFTGPGTDLTVGLPFNHRWLGGTAPAANGITNIANMPTEEVFTAPHHDRVNGEIAATMPLNYGGNLIENFALTFKDGVVVDMRAEKGLSLLRSLVETDEGSRRLGEVALVPHSSPISQAGTLFYNTLFDENAASHIALGRAYRNCIVGCEDLSDEDFAAVGGNSSNTHVDFMIGSDHIDVDATLSDGTVEPLMRSGEWV